MVFAGLHARTPGVHDAHETFENAVQWGDPLYQNMFRMQAYISQNAVDVGNPDNARDPMTITGITQAAAAIVTVGAHDAKVGDRVYFSDVQGMTEINGLTGTVTAIGSISFSVDINSTGFTAYTSGGVATLLGSQNILRPGLIMSYNHALKEWLNWDPGGANGSELIRGMLYVEQQMMVQGNSEPRWRGFIIWGGPVIAGRIIIPGEVTPGIVGHAQEGAIRSALADQWVLDDYFQQTTQ